MSTFTNIPKIIFDPEIYMAILNQILKISKSNNIDVYTILLLNSVYMNEMLDKDIEWKDRTDDEYKDFINDRINKFIKYGVDLILLNNSLTKNNINNTNQNNQNISCKKNVSFFDPINMPSTDDDIENNDNCEITLSDLVDSMPTNQNDDYYKKVNKLESSSSSSSKNNVKFC